MDASELLGKLRRPRWTRIDEWDYNNAEYKRNFVYPRGDDAPTQNTPQWDFPFINVAPLDVQGRPQGYMWTPKYKRPTTDPEYPREQMWLRQLMGAGMDQERVNFVLSNIMRIQARERGDRPVYSTSEDEDDDEESSASGSSSASFSQASQRLQEVSQQITNEVSYSQAYGAMSEEDSNLDVELSSQGAVQGLLDTLPARLPAAKSLAELVVVKEEPGLTDAQTFIHRRALGRVQLDQDTLDEQQSVALQYGRITNAGPISAMAEEEIEKLAQVCQSLLALLKLQWSPSVHWLQSLYRGHNTVSDPITGKKAFPYAQRPLSVRLDWLLNSKDNLVKGLWLYDAAKNAAIPLYPAWHSNRLIEPSHGIFDETIAHDRIYWYHRSVQADVDVNSITAKVGRILGVRPSNQHLLKIPPPSVAEAYRLPPLPNEVSSPPKRLASTALSDALNTPEPKRRYPLTQPYTTPATPVATAGSLVSSLLAPGAQTQSYSSDVKEEEEVEAEQAGSPFSNFSSPSQYTTSQMARSTQRRVASMSIKAEAAYEIEIEAAMPGPSAPTLTQIVAEAQQLGNEAFESQAEAKLAMIARKRLEAQQRLAASRNRWAESQRKRNVILQYLDRSAPQVQPVVPIGGAIAGDDDEERLVPAAPEAPVTAAPGNAVTNSIRGFTRNTGRQRYGAIVFNDLTHQPGHRRREDGELGDYLFANRR